MDAAISTEMVADQEIAVAVREITGFPGIGKSLQGRDDSLLLRVRGIVANPYLEQITEDIKGLDAVRGFLPETSESSR